MLSLDQRFQQLCGPFYRPEHISADGFSAPDRHGQWRHHGLLQLSVGVLMLPATGHGIRDPAQLAEMASHAKHEAKRVPGFSVVCANLETAGAHLSINQTTSQASR